ncbi:hypothetical protein TYRP_014749 [Tyrophagus putrescentiae]|nr:hypothetical protein TYRP_014749 [Tyrophagus putrescentiae]
MSTTNNKNNIMDYNYNPNREEDTSLEARLDALLTRLRNGLVERLVGPDCLPALESRMRAARAAIVSLQQNQGQAKVFWGYPDVRAMWERGQGETGPACYLSFGRTFLHFGMLFPSVKVYAALGDTKYKVRLTFIYRRPVPFRGPFEDLYVYMDLKTQDQLLADLAARGLVDGRPLRRGIGLYVAMKPYWQQVRKYRAELEEERVRKEAEAKAKGGRGGGEEEQHGLVRRSAA